MSLHLPSVKSSAAVAATTIFLVGVIAPSAGASPAGGSGTTAVATTAASLPPGLVAIEQQMEQLQVSSDRFSMKAELGGSGLTGKGGLFEIIKGGRGKGTRKAGGGKAIVRGAQIQGGRAQVTTGMPTPKMIPLFTGVGEQSLSTEAGATEVAVFKGKVLGALPVEIRLVGGEGYVHEAGIAGFDNGRPWLRMSTAEISEEDDSYAPIGPGTGSAGSLFGQLPKDFDLAEEVTEVGPATVDGEQTTEFAATLSTRKFLEGSSADEGRTESSQEVRKALAKAKVTLDVFFEPDGLPLRTSVAIHAKSVSMTFEVSILAIDVPVEVSAPPTNETISEAQLKALEKRKLKQAMRKPHLTRRERRIQKRLRVCAKHSQGPDGRLVRKRFRSCMRKVESQVEAKSKQ